MPNTLTDDNNEIDIKELVLSIWANKLIIIISILTCALISGNSALNMEKRYTSEVLFSLNDPNQKNQLSIFSNLPGFNGFPKLGGGSSNEVAAILEEIKTRLFIERINKLVNLLSDPEFNSYNPNNIEPLWKSKLKQIIGYKSLTRNHNEMAWQSVIKTFKKNVKISLTNAGLISLSVSHNKPDRAAEIANVIMESIILQNKKHTNQIQDNQINYLSTKLGDALYDLEKSQFKLKEFTMKSSALPIEAFEAESLKLGSLKVQLEGTNNLLYAAKDLSNVLISDKRNRENYLTLRNNYPIIDDVEFRRIFGLSEIIKEWSWPNKENVIAIIDILEDRKKRLEISISSSQSKAKKFAENVENFATLERKNTNSQATYTVLIEQVKAELLQAGYRPDRSKIYEYAFAPTTPSSPNRTRIIMLGSIIGLLIGIISSLIVTNRKNTFYTTPSFAISKKGNIFNSKKLYKRRKKSLGVLDRINTSQHEPVLQNIIIEINNSKKNIINISNLGSKLAARDLARIIGINMQGKKLNVVHIDFSLSLNSSIKKNRTYKESNYAVFDQFNSFICLGIKNSNQTKDYISDKETIMEIRELTKDFDIVLISSENNDVNNLARALKNEDIFHISLARKGITSRKELNIISNILPIGSLLYA
jgi:uncharacterized protein involved in exopolysaccharide biosynthesis